MGYGAYSFLNVHLLTIKGITLMRIKQWVSFPLNAKRLIFQSVD